MRFSPFCNCCVCAATTGTVCVCTCFDPIPTTATIEDAEGTWTFAYLGGAFWQIAVTTPEATWFMANPAGGATDCATQGSLGHYEYAYQLAPVCSGDPSAWTWKLTIITPLGNCTGPPVNPPGVLACCYAQANTGLGNFIFTPVWTKTTATIPFVCDVSDGLTFTLPTTLACGLPMPGGGGPITVILG